MNPRRPPSLTVLENPKLFDEFKNASDWQAQLSLLIDRSEPICRLRYGWFLNYSGKPAASLEHLEPVKNIPLGFMLRLEALAALGEDEALCQGLVSWQPFGPEHPEADILGFELNAYVYGVLQKHYRLAFRYLYRAEALAMHYSMNRRLQVIHNNLEHLANEAGLSTTHEKLLKNDLHRLGLPQNTKFQSYFRAGNLTAIAHDEMLDSHYHSLAQATLRYRDLTKDHLAPVDAAKLISDKLPHHSEARVYWALLMLQIYAKRGALKGLCSPERILTILDKALGELRRLEVTVLGSFVARTYPLGAALAARLDERLVFLETEVATVWSDYSRDGLRLQDEVTPITKRVREALVLDGLKGETEQTHTLFRLHGEYKRRLYSSLEQRALALNETTSIGAVYRGLAFLGTDLNDVHIAHKAQNTLANSSFLQTLL